MEMKEEKKKNIVLPITIISVIVLAIVCFGIYKLLSSKPKNIYIATIDRFAESLTKSIDKQMEGGSKDKIELSFDIKSSDSMINAIAKILNKLNAKIDIEADLNKKVINMGIDALYNNGSMLKLNYYITEKDVFLEAKDLYDKAIRIMDGEELENMLNNTSSDDMKFIIRELANSIKKSLKNEYFNVSDEAIKVNGKNISVKKEVLN